MINEEFPTKIGTRLEIIIKEGKRFHVFFEDKSPVPHNIIKQKFAVFASMMFTDEKARVAR